MKLIKCILLLAILAAAQVHCPGAEKPKNKKMTLQQMTVEGNNRFALELYAKLQEQEGNLFLSPYSISTALAMTYAGARGRTEAQMAKVLQLPIIERVTASQVTTDRQQLHSNFGAVIQDLNNRGEKGAYELIVANALWGQRGYRCLNEFQNLIKTNYAGRLTEVDFIRATERARKTINTWVAKETRDKIKNLIPPGALNRLTRLVLTNAIYFKGNWAQQFKEDRTKQVPFTLLNGEKTTVPMMNQTAQFRYMQAQNFQGLELPYVDDELSMIILLPKELDGLKKIEKELTLENLSKWLPELHKIKVVVAVPRFKMTSQFGLAGVLGSMGMEDAFTSQADFSGITGNKDLSISAVIHKAYIDVNEKGTEAAAATGVAMGITSVRPSPPVFRADHPFLFLIRDNQTGSILFIGRLTNPKQ